MSDDDRLADYVARMENSSHTRTLSDGCEGCSHSLVFCNCCRYIEGPTQRCCTACSH